ncbi:MFS transporter [Pseudoclavibacter endophyticus]|uniref:MFS transporter n=1 Tax=Pseudoclavibacter endophyticus TaxID=1778590 RepID=A0A6H9WNF7_9MICO|nr:MFS transporter [Pseudoclavibacter endophyticus]KAB1650396.1 MFS transporter [Pseudoclavibacter endophyticus]GGA54511.1 MFS transporter [Pseudoclavibacter endophyticus]
MKTDPRRTREQLWTRQTAPFIAGTLTLMTFIAFESFAVTTILPVVTADLGGTAWYSFAYAATITTALIGMVIGGNWADQSGPRTPLMIGGTLFLLGLALTVVAPDIGTFILGRLLQGVGGGIDSVCLYVLIARHVPEGPRPRMFGLLTTAWLVPSLAGPLIAGFLTDLTTWRTVLGIVLVGSAAALLCLLRVTQTPSAQDEFGPRHPSPGDRSWSKIVGRSGSLALLAAVLLVVLHLAGQLNTFVSVVVVAVASLALIITARGILPAGTLLLRGAPQRLIALRAILGATVTTTDLYLTLYLQTERGYPPTTAGLVIALGAAGWALGAWLQGRFSSTQRTHGRLVLLATVLVAFGPATALAYTSSNLPLGVVVAACIAMGTGMGTAYPRLSSATLALVSAERQGAYSSALQAGESMSIGVLTALIAALLATGVTFTTLYGVLLGLALVAILVAATGSTKRHAETS